MVLPVFHFCIVALNLYTLWYDQKYITLPLEPKQKEQLESLPFKGRLLFLTIWCLIIQTLYFTLALVNDIIGSNARSPKKAPRIRIIKDTLFSLAFPLAVFVCLAFWSIFFYNNELIMPTKFMKDFPYWVNIVMHTLIVPFVLVESFVSVITYPSKKVGISLGLLFIFAYVGLLAKVYLNTGTLVYPFFDVMTGPMKIGFIAGGAVFGLMLYFLGEFFNDWNDWTKVTDTSKSYSKSKSNSKKKHKRA